MTAGLYARIRERTDGMDPAMPNLRDYGLSPEQRAAYELAIAAYHAETRDLVRQFQAGGRVESTS